jgi:hypothetical protein
LISSGSNSKAVYRMVADGPEKSETESIATFRENYHPPFENHEDFRRGMLDM